MNHETTAPPTGNLSQPPVTVQAPCKLLASADADREKWLEARYQLLTATEAAAVLGWPNPGARLDLWYRKRKEIDNKKSVGLAQEASEMGHELEALAAQLFQKRTGRVVQRDQGLYQSTKYPWLGTTIDYRQIVVPAEVSFRDVAPLRRPLELKSSVLKEKWMDGEDPNMDWMLQLTQQMLVLGSDMGSLSVIFGAPVFHHRHADFELDPELAEMTLTETEHFWKLIQKNQPPKWGDDYSTYEVLKRLDARRVRGTIALLSEDLFDVDDEYVHLKSELTDAKAKVKLLEDRLEVTEAKIGAAIGEHSAGVLPNKILYTFPVTNIAARHQDAYHYRKLTRKVPKPTAPLAPDDQERAKPRRRSKKP